jgi:hypothetical protein
MYSEFKFSPSMISQQAAETAKALAAIKPGVNALKFAAETMADRLRAKPGNYLQYGPYWWAVKRVLRMTLVEDFGPNDDEGIRSEYGDGFPFYARLVAAEQFRAYYGANFLAGTDRFDLDADGEESYVLFDTDMEIRKIGAAHPLRVAADLQSQEVEAEVVLDSAWAAPEAASLTPFAVKFEHEAKLWTANVYALDAVGAQAKVSLMDRSGRLGRAIDFSKSVGEAALDSTDRAEPLYVDRAARSVSEMAATGVLAA